MSFIIHKEQPSKRSAPPKVRPFKVYKLVIYKRNDAERRFDVKEKLISNRKIAAASHFNFK